LDADYGFDSFNSFNAKRISHFSQKNIQTAAVIETGEGKCGDDLCGAVFGLKRGDVCIGFCQSREFQKGSAGEAANIGVFVLQHGEESGNGGWVGAVSEESGSGCAGEPIGILGGCTKKWGGLGGGKNAGGFDGFTSNGGIRVTKGGAKNGEGRGALGWGECERADGERANCWGGIAKGKAVGLG
jgi:hypothetical protein